MSFPTTVFQYEIRFDHILNFSQISRKILSPFVKLCQGIKFENQDTLEERIIFNFTEDNYVIIVGWDRILIRGQGDLDNYTTNNSFVETPFLTMLERLKELEEFGTIKNVLLAVNCINDVESDESELVKKFSKIVLKPDSLDLLSNISDVAVILENNRENSKQSLTYGPYFGPEDLTRRPLIPVNINELKNLDKTGIMVEYKDFKITSKASFNEFKLMVESSKKIINKVWTIY